jgi:hypothetical protein
MIDHQALIKLLHYAPKSGEFRWRMTRGKMRAGSRAGTIRRSRPGVPPYRKIHVLGRGYFASRLAVFYMTGEWPTGQVDHKDRDTLNDRWGNLRPASQSQNMANSAVRSDNRSGFKGVSFNKGRSSWHVHISVKGKRIFLGRFETAEKGHAAYCVAADAFFGEFARAA